MQRLEAQNCHRECGRQNEADSKSDSRKNEIDESIQWDMMSEYDIVFSISYPNGIGDKVGTQFNSVARKSMCPEWQFREYWQNDRV
jgi:hypothetical protein